MQILQSEACAKHYSSEYFTPVDLLKVLKSLFIATKVGPKEYLMPCVLEVSDIYPSYKPSEDKVESSFVLHFSEVVQVVRNSTIFQLPQKLPGKLIFRDPLSSYLEIVVELPKIAAEHSLGLYNAIRDTFIMAIKQAMQTLRYGERTPELSFLCPEQSSHCSTFPHVGSVDDTHSFLTCSIRPDMVTNPLTPEQKMWLTNSDNG